MGNIARRGILLVFLGMVAGCSTTALESQNKAQDGRQARIYFLRNSSMLALGGVAPEIQVNGQKIGTLANNSSFFVDRDPGQYRVSIITPMETGRYALDMKLAPGSLHYIEVTPRPEFVATTMMAGVGGGIAEQANAREMSGRFKLIELDSRTGLANLERLKK